MGVTRRPGHWKLASVTLALATLYSGCSLAGDVTPPPALATAQAAAPAPTTLPAAELDPPPSQANLAAGGRLYADRCAACHGPAGMGDGELAAELSFPPAALADPELARPASPQSWFSIVTNGRLDRLMPPFASLSDQQRWDVVAYALSLSITDEQLQAGEALFDQNCAQCHAAAGFDAEYLQTAARSDLFAVVRDGRGDEMPAFGDQLDDRQLWAVAGYLQSRAWEAAAADEPQVEQVRTSSAAVVGRVAHGTAGLAVPPDLRVRILGFDGEQQVVDELVMVDAQGGFRLEPVEIAPGRLFFATLEYQGVQYRSEVAHAPADGSPLELPLTIYGTSADSAPLQVERLHLLIDFPEAGVMRVLQLWVVANQSDRVVAPGLRVPLPEAAGNLGFEEGELGDRFERTATGFIDHEPVPPGSGIDQLVFGFDLVREGALEYQQPLEHPVQAVTVLVPEDAPRLTGLIDEGVRDLGGLRMRSYAAQGLAPGDRLEFRVAGSGGFSGPALSASIGAAALVLALYLVLRARSASLLPGSPPRGGTEGADPQDLLRAIAQLDAEHEAGRLDPEQWQQRRAALKQQALDRMRGERG